MNPKILVIVESPQRATVLNRLYAQRLTAIATYGDVSALHSPQDGAIAIDRETLLGHYVLTDSPRRHIDGERVIQQLQQFLQAHPGTQVYLGMESGQAGETLAAFVAHFLQLSTPRRLHVNAFTQSDLDHAIANAGGFEQSAVDAHVAREQIDHIGSRTMASFCRQAGDHSPAFSDGHGAALVALVVERERAIGTDAKGVQHFTVHVDLGGWSAQWRMPPPKEQAGLTSNSQFAAVDTIPPCSDEAVADLVSRQRALFVRSVDVFSESLVAPSALCTHELVAVATRVMGWAPERTLNVAQQLYQGDGGDGFITSPRTSVTSISSAVAASIRSWLESQGLPVPTTPDAQSTCCRSALMGSEAIRPTNWEVEEAGSTGDQTALYALIRDRTLFSQLAPAIYNVQETVLTDAQGAHTFSATSRVLSVPGWLDTTAVHSQAVDVPTIQSADTLPRLKIGEIVTALSTQVRAHPMPEPLRFTPATLLVKLQSLGLARSVLPPEFARMLRVNPSITHRHDGTLAPTEQGQRWYDTVYPRFAFAHLAYAVELEQALDMVASGDLAGPALVRTVWDRLDADAVSPSYNTDNTYHLSKRP